MSFIHIKKQTIRRGDVPQEVFAVSAVALTTTQGKKLIPNPAGTETCVFTTFEEAEEAVRRAGFDYIYEGQKYYIAQVTKVEPPRQTVYQGPASILDAIPTLMERLQDREPAAVANAAYALGELGAAQAVKPLMTLLGHEDGSVRKEVAEALAKLGDHAIALLRTAFYEARRSREKNANHIRLTVVNTYLEMTHSRRELLVEVLPQLVEALSDESWLVRSQAALAIGHSARFFREDGA
jgi:hypothetical protein